MSQTVRVRICGVDTKHVDLWVFKVIWSLGRSVSSRSSLMKISCFLSQSFYTCFIRFIVYLMLCFTSRFIYFLQCYKSSSYLQRWPRTCWRVLEIAWVQGEARIPDHPRVFPAHSSRPPHLFTRECCESCKLIFAAMIHHTRIHRSRRGRVEKSPSRAIPYVIVEIVSHVGNNVWSG